jgi:beta-lactam-binding protein with PASTA domain
MRLLRDLVGETLSERYRVVARIAGGGMGEVYRGHDLLLDRSVAIKVLQPSLANDPDLVARFRAEARAAARLSHPNVVAVHDWGQENDRTYYMIMEYVAGTDLRAILVGRGPFDPAHACDVGVALCEALEAAHQQGLVHRDVKPENVLIARDGTVKVADFGIAAVADAERTLPGGSILGTLRYLSPEQASGEEATSGSDIWAAGAVLFEMLTGTPPSGGTGAELLRRRAEEIPVAPSTLEEGIPEALDEIVLTACSLDPARRYRTAAEMGAAIRSASVGLKPRSRPIRELLVDVTDEIYLPDAEPTDLNGRDGYLGRRRRRLMVRVLRSLLVLAVLAGLAFGGWQAAGALMGPQEVDVPRLGGLPLQRAQAIATESELEIEVTGRARDPDVPEGSIIRQVPQSGVILEGETISVILSKGPPLVKVPDLGGKPLSKARAKLTELGFQIGDVKRVYSVEDPVGTVVKVDASSKRLERGSTVDLIVSQGPRMFEVLDVVGMAAEKAQKKLEGMRFKVALVNVYSNSVPEGKVVSTSPSAGESAPERSTVEVAVSIGPEFRKFSMPDVRGMSVSDARAKLERMGLKVKVSQSCPGQTVVETSPLAGTKVREGERVTLFVC